MDATTDGPAVSSLPASRSVENSQRVCDRCISKKVKCDLQRPRCSRCLETDSQCVYSAVKRRPGPRKGWTRSAKGQAAHGVVASGSGVDHERLRSTHNLETSSLPAASVSRNPTIVNGDASWTPPPPLMAPPSERSTLNHLSFDLKPEQARALLGIYFDQDHHTIPLFDRQIFMEQYEAGRIPSVLVNTIAAVTAVIFAEKHTDRPIDARTYLDNLLRSPTTTELEINIEISLHEFQLLCLLAHYDFHQRPGPRSWVRIGNLARKSYRLGLHQLENPAHCALYDGAGVLAEKEEWRRLWWTIYCLDSYANVTAGTPLIVELQSVRTALPMFHDFQTAGIRCNPTQPLFLPADTADMWEVMQRLTSCGLPHEFDMHVAMTCMINEAATCFRLCRQNPSSRLMLRIKKFEDHLTAARLALPTDYLDPGRRVWTQETGAQHHARLFNIVLMHSATIMLMLAKLCDAPGGDDALRWQRVLECCEEIVNAVKYWDTKKLTTADPAICFTFSGVLTLLHVCSKCSPASTASTAAAELQANFDRQIRILKLYLEHFGTHWFLPRFLLASHEKLTQLISNPMTIHEAKRVIQGHQTLLQQRWLSTMARLEQTDNLAQEHQAAAEAVAYFDEWPLEQWISDLINSS